jgi:hypothetical protein
MRIAQAEASGSARFDQRQRLDHFDSRPRKDRALDVSPRGKYLAFGVDDGKRPAMKTFDFIAAAHFDQNWIGCSQAHGRRTRRTMRGSKTIAVKHTKRKQAIT